MPFAYGALTLSGWLSQNHSANFGESLMQSVTPECTHSGLGSSAFARRYLRNRVFFLFLRVLRCFSSPGSPPYVMDWRMDDRGPLCRVSPFGHPRIKGYLLLPAAFRSLSRPSSAPGAKASSLRSSSLDLRGSLLSRVRFLLKLFSAFCCLPAVRRKISAAFAASFLMSSRLNRKNLALH